MSVVKDIYKRINMYERQLNALDKEMIPRPSLKHVDMLDGNIRHFEILLAISKLRREVYEYER